jgi:hypothetical protein
MLHMFLEELAAEIGLQIGREFEPGEPGFQLTRVRSVRQILD